MQKIPLAPPPFLMLADEVVIILDVRVCVSVCPQMWIHQYVCARMEI